MKKCMFKDGRSKKVVFIAHCFLNQNAISDGTAVYPAAFKDVIEFFIKNDIGIVQMPCHELCCLGLDRGNIHGADSPVVVENTRIRSEMEKDTNSARLDQIVDYVTYQITEYKLHGFEIVGIVGANRSPNCGVDTTSDNNAEINGQGVFMEKIASWLSERNIFIPMVGLKGTDNISDKLQWLLKRE